MKKFLILPALALICLTLTACPDDTDTPTPTPVTPVITLPFNASFKDADLSGDSTTLTVSGLTFKGAGTSDTSACISSDGAKIRQQYAGVLLAYYPKFNCIIGDLTNVPAMNKITVTIDDNCGTCTRVRVCKDGQVIDAANNLGMGQNKAYILNIGNQKADKIIIMSGEAVAKSITIE